MEQAHFPANTAMVALFGFLKLVQMGVELFLIAPCGAVNAGQHRVAMITTPVGASHLHQLESRANILCGAQMRPTAQVQPLALTIDGNIFALGQVADQLRLEAFSALFKKSDGVIAVPDLAHEGLCPLHDFTHALFNGGEIIRGERLGPVEIVIEPVFNGRPNGHLRTGEQVLHGFGQHMGGIVADQFKGFGVFAGNEAQSRIMADILTDIAQAAIHFHGQCGFGQSGPDRFRHRRPRNRPVKTANRTVG